MPQYEIIKTNDNTKITVSVRDSFSGDIKEILKITEEQKRLLDYLINHYYIVSDCEFVDGSPNVADLTI